MGPFLGCLSRDFQPPVGIFLRDRIVLDFFQQGGVEHIKQKTSCFHVFLGKGYPSPVSHPGKKYHVFGKRYLLFRQHCMKKRILVIRKFVKSAEKIIISFVFVCFRFTDISYFLSFPSNENVRKQHLSTNAYFCVNMKFSWMIA